MNGVRVLKLTDRRQAALIVSMAGLVAGLALARPPIVIRHDRDDAAYCEKGRRFPAVCQIGRAGDGTLIGPEWVLTAAHVAKAVQGRKKPPAVQFAGREYAVVEVVIHPQWTEMGPHDIGLLRLEKPVEGVQPIGLYLKSDERGKTAILLGHGDTRTGKGGPWIQDGKLRGATSKVERTDAKWIYFVFDEPPGGATAAARQSWKRAASSLWRASVHSELTGPTVRGRTEPRTVLSAFPPMHGGSSLRPEKARFRSDVFLPQ